MGVCTQQLLSYNLGSKVEVADSEVFAVYKALEDAQSFPLVFFDNPRFYIFVDSQAAIQRIQNTYTTNHIGPRKSNLPPPRGAAW